MPSEDHFLKLLEGVSRVDERTLAIQQSQQEHQALVRKWLLDTSASVDVLTDRVAAIEKVHVADALRKEVAKSRAVWWAKAGGTLSVALGAFVAVIQQLGWLK